MFRDSSPTFGPTHFSSANPPPSPPFSAHNDPLDDIYGSGPSSPVLDVQNHWSRDASDDRSHEILSDLPSRQRALDTDAYREGLSNSKGQHVQQGFDEGYSLGANLGQRVGYILGALQSLLMALKGHDEAQYQRAKDMWSDAQKELAIEELLGQQWVDEEGIWKWNVKGAEDDVTFREVAEQHPTIMNWLGKVNAVARACGVELHAQQNSEDVTTEEQL